MRTGRAFSIINCLFFACGLVLEILPLRAAQANGLTQTLTKDQEERIRKRLDEDREKYENLEPVTIYGRVIDQYGKPVTDADVCISWERATLLLGKSDFGRRDWLKTDRKGEFEFTCAKPLRAFAQANKEGFEGPLGGFTDDLIWHPTSASKPVVITLRKKGETTFLLKGDKYMAIRVESPHSQTNRIDVLWNREDGKSLMHQYNDFRVSADFIPNSNAWSVTYSTLDDTDMLLLTNALLYVAPSGGYGRSVTLGAPPWPQYMYLKSRSPSIYTKIELDHSCWKEGDDKRFFRVSYRAWVNPYGEKNLEYDQRMETNGHVEVELKSEAKRAIRSQRLPSKPEIGQRIKAMNEKLERAAAEQKTSKGL